MIAVSPAARTPETIAVVGNAPLPPSPARAAAIDSADLVLRMTTFALDAEGAAPAVGRRTDVVVVHRALRAGPDTFHDHRRRLYLLAEPGRQYWESERLPGWWPPDLALVPISNQEFTAPLRAALRMGASQVTWPTTGTLAVHLMHQVFPEASVRFTGTSVLHRDANATQFEHQWGGPVDVTSEHRLHAERTALTHWIRDGWLEVLP